MTRSRLGGPVLGLALIGSALLLGAAPAQAAEPAACTAADAGKLNSTCVTPVDRTVNYARDDDKPYGYGQDDCGYGYHSPAQQWLDQPWAATPGGDTKNKGCDQGGQGGDVTPRAGDLPPWVVTNVRRQAPPAAPELPLTGSSTGMIAAYGAALILGGYGLVRGRRARGRHAALAGRHR